MGYISYLILESGLMILSEFGVYKLLELTDTSGCLVLLILNSGLAYALKS